MDLLSDVQLEFIAKFVPIEDARMDQLDPNQQDMLQSFDMSKKLFQEVLDTNPPETVRENIRRFIAGDALLNVVDPARRY